VVAPFYNNKRKSEKIATRVVKMWDLDRVDTYLSIPLNQLNNSLIQYMNAQNVGEQNLVTPKTVKYFSNNKPCVTK